MRKQKSVDWNALKEATLSPEELKKLKGGNGANGTDGDDIVGDEDVTDG
ncbi:MAG: hypothetical protein MRY78_19090 [Saprospiraceae bacterium]|nr:hypothetical protein [Saprospiraceae bacterium]